jgi:hypothetical protein
MSESRDKNILRQALQKIQRDERAKSRTTRKNISNPRKSAPARHTSPEIGTPINLVSFNPESSSRTKPSEVVNPSNLPEESSVSLDSNQNLSSVTLE